MKDIPVHLDMLVHKFKFVRDIIYIKRTQYLTSRRKVSSSFIVNSHQETFQGA